MAKYLVTRVRTWEVEAFGPTWAKQIADTTHPDTEDEQIELIESGCENVGEDTGDVPFKCEGCGERFQAPPDTIRHRCLEPVLVVRPTNPMMDRWTPAVYGTARRV